MKTMNKTANVVFLKRKYLKESRWVGKIGELLEEIPVIVEHIYVFPNEGMYPEFLVKMKTEAGDILAWKTGTWSLVGPRRKGVLTGTVKEHREFRGVKETRVCRCKLRRAR